MLKQSFATLNLSFNIVDLLHAKVNRRYFSFNSQIYILISATKKTKTNKQKKIGRIRMVIVRSGVGVNYREPPDEIGRVGISVLYSSAQRYNVNYVYTP